MEFEFICNLPVLVDVGVLLALVSRYPLAHLWRLVTVSVTFYIALSLDVHSPLEHLFRFEVYQRCLSIGQVEPEKFNITINR